MDMPNTNTCRIVVGRLVEIDVSQGYRTAADLDAMTAQIRAAFAQAPANKRVVIVADWRACQVLTPAVAAQAVAMMTSTNARVERSGLLHGAAQPTSVLQLMRLVKETQFANRKLFTDIAQMEAWFGEVLEPAERARLHVFLTKA